MWNLFIKTTNFLYVSYYTDKIMGVNKTIFIFDISKSYTF